MCLSLRMIKFYQSTFFFTKLGCGRICKISITSQLFAQHGWEGEVGDAKLRVHTT